MATIVSLNEDIKRLSQELDEDRMLKLNRFLFSTLERLLSVCIEILNFRNKRLISKFLFERVCDWIFSSEELRDYVKKELNIVRFEDTKGISKRIANSRHKHVEKIAYDAIVRVMQNLGSYCITREIDLNVSNDRGEHERNVDLKGISLLMILRVMRMASIKDGITVELFEYSKRILSWHLEEILDNVRIKESHVKRYARYLKVAEDEVSIIDRYKMCEPLIDHLVFIRFIEDMDAEMDERDVWILHMIGENYLIDYYERLLFISGNRVLNQSMDFLEFTYRLMRRYDL